MFCSNHLHGVLNENKNKQTKKTNVTKRPVAFESDFMKSNMEKTELTEENLLLLPTFYSCSQAVQKALYKTFNEFHIVCNIFYKPSQP